jgi:hypothetical protein
MSIIVNTITKHLNLRIAFVDDFYETCKVTRSYTATN